MGKSTSSILHSNRSKILTLAQRYGARNVRLFGSLAKGHEKEDSDVDLLLDFEPGRSLLDHVALWQDLEDLLNCSVDVVTEKSLHPALRDEILKQSIPL